MSTGAILTVLSNIPWGQVIDNAPKVAEGAAKLWGSVAGLRRKTAPVLETVAQTGETKATEIEMLRTEVLDMAKSVKTLSGQMNDSSALIKALAEQNSQLIIRMELNRAQLLKAQVAIFVLGASLTPAMVYLWLQR